MADTGNGSVELRIRLLERRQRLMTAVLGGLSLVLVAAAATDRPGTVRAGSFELVADDGSVRAVLAVEDGAPALHLRDAAGRDRVSLVQQDDADGLFIADGDGTVRIGIAQFAHGGGGVALHGPLSKGAAVLYLKGDGSLTFYAPDGTVEHRVPGALEPAGE